MAIRGQATPRPARSLASVPTRFDLSEDNLASLLAGEPAYRARQVWQGLYDHGVGPDELTTLPTELRSRLADEPALQPALRAAAESVADGGDTVKWLWELHD